MMHTQDAMLALAGSVIERARDLISDGWVKGMMNTKVDGAPSHFCIEGALYLAAEETFGIVKSTGRRQAMVLAPAGHEVLNIARTFILDEVEEQLARTFGNIPGYNDDSARTEEEVLSVLEKAGQRCWNLSIENEELARIDLSRYAKKNTGSEKAEEYLQAVLA